MKLHLPKGLLAVLLSCFVSTAAFTYGEPTITSSDGKTTVAMGTNDSQTTNPLVSGDTALEVNVNGTGVTWGSVVNDAGQVVSTAQVGSDVTATVNIAENASLSVGTTDVQYSVFTKQGGQTINVGKNAILTTTCSLAGWQNNSPSSMTTAINLGEGATWDSGSTMGTDKCEYLHRTIVTMNGAKINVASGSAIRSERGGNGANKFVTRADAAAESTIQGDGSLITQNHDITFDVAARTNKTDATVADLVVSTTLSIGNNGDHAFIKSGTGVLNVTKGGSVHLKVQNGVLNLGAGATLGTLTTESGVSNVSGTVTTVHASGGETNVSGTVTTVNTSGGETNVSGTVTTVNASGGVTNLNANGTIKLIDIRGSQGAFNGTVNIVGEVAANNIWLSDITSKANAKLNIVGSGQLTYDSVIWSSIDGIKNATLTNNGATEGDANKFLADRPLYTIADAAVTYGESANKTFAVKLKDSSLVHNGTGTVTLTNTGNTIVAISGSGSVVMNGGVVSGTLNVSSFNGSGTAEITGSITGGAVRNVNILSTQSQLGSTILSGNINFDVQNGNFDYNGEGTYSTATGIQTVTRDTILISGVDATQFTGVSFKVNGEAADNLTIDADGIRGSVTTNTTTYLIANKTDVVSWSDVTSAGGSLVKFTAGGKLTMADTDVISSSAIEVATGVAGSRLSGSGTYVLESGSTDIKVDSLTDWTGTVELSGSHTGLDLSSAKLGNAGSTILLDNVTGKDLATATVNANVELTYRGTNAQKADGLVITGNKADITFNGNVTGVLTGNRTEINVLNQVSGTKLNFTGSENKNVQIVDEAGSAISFSKNATDISTSIVSQKGASTGKTSVSFDNVSDVSMRGNILNDKWSDWHAKGDLSVNLNENTKVTFSGTVHANTLNVASGAEASFTKATSLDKVVGSGTFSSTVEQGITLGTATDSKFTGSIKALGGAVIQAAFAGTDAQEGSLAKIDAAAGSVNLLNTSSVTVTDMVIGEGQTVGVYRGDTTTATTDSEGTLTVTNLTVTSGEGGAATLNANLNLTGTTLTLNGVLTLGSELTLGSGNTLSGVDWSSLTDGNYITLITGVDSIAGGYTGPITASNVFSNVTNTDTKSYSLVYNDQAQTLTLQASNVPEPTTATLSLLALMGLAARRRRKAAK